MAETRENPTPGRDDHVIAQGWSRYTGEHHAIWRALFERQSRLLVGRASRQFLGGLEGLGVAAEAIPEFERLSDILEAATGWRIVAVPGLVPDDVFFRHLAGRRFPATNWIRKPEQMDYIQEPDVFHDVFGHVPLLMNPAFADYMAAYGKAGLAADAQGELHYLARLYWYTVEFGLMRSSGRLFIYGSGIVSSRAESVYCLESPIPARVAFDPMRVMRTAYKIDDLQAIYFVIERFEDLFRALDRDLAPCYAALGGKAELEPGRLIATDRLFGPNVTIDAKEVA